MRSLKGSTAAAMCGSRRARGVQSSGATSDPFDDASPLVIVGLTAQARAAATIP
jgi:hypothetical protein